MSHTARFLLVPLLAVPALALAAPPQLTEQLDRIEEMLGEVLDTNEAALDALDAAAGERDSLALGHDTIVDGNDSIIDATSDLAGDVDLVSAQLDAVSGQIADLAVEIGSGGAGGIAIQSVQVTESVLRNIHLRAYCDEPYELLGLYGGLDQPFAKPDGYVQIFKTLHVAGAEITQDQFFGNGPAQSMLAGYEVGSAVGADGGDWVSFETRWSTSETSDPTTEIDQEWTAVFATTADATCVVYLLDSQPQCVVDDDCNAPLICNYNNICAPY